MTRIQQILSKIDSFEDIERLDVYEVTYLSNYLQNIMIDLFLQGKIKDCPIELEIKADREYATELYRTYGSFDW